MWRFAVYTHKTSLLSKKCVKTVGLALKHTDRRADYIRFLSNDTPTSSIRLENDPPIPEVFSLDDFGLLSVNRSQSIESMSSAGSEHTFLEQLFRNDTLNTFSNVQIPTTMSSKELGGSSDVFGYDYVSELLSEGAIAEELAEDILEEEVQESASYHDDQVPSTSGLEVTALPFLIPNLEEEDKKDTRKLLSEKMRRERKLNLSTLPPVPVEHTQNIEHVFHVPKVSQIQNIWEMMFPDSLPEESFTSQWEDGMAPTVIKAETTSDIEIYSDVSTEFSLEVLEGIIANGTMEELQKELDAVGVWPEYLFLGEQSFHARTGWILRFVVENSQCFADAEKTVKAFATSHMLAIVPDDVLLHLVTKKITETSTIQSISSDLENLSILSMSRELRPHRPFVKDRLIVLYNIAVQKCMETSPTLLSLCTKLNFDRSADVFMGCYAEAQVSSPHKNFVKDFNAWKKLSTKYGSLEGIDHYWMEAIRSEKEVAKKVASLLTHSGKFEHPFATMARLICALIKTDQLDKALEVFKFVSVSGQHFKEQLNLLVEKKDLASIERLSVLVERGMIAEKRRGGKRAAANGGEGKTAEETEKPSLLGKDFHTVLANFYGVGGAGKKKKFVDKKLKKKIHRVDEEQLHYLCKSIQKAWISCADDNDSINRLVGWCQQNRIEIDEKVQKKVNFLLQKSS